jgi:hypothetical protein
MTKRKMQYWVIPPKANGEFVACMEDVLAIYARPFDPAQPRLSPDCGHTAPIRYSHSYALWRRRTGVSP